MDIVDQPSIENEYALAISIEDRQPGSAFYSIAGYASDQAFEKCSGRSGKLVWSGRLDEEARTTCHDKVCNRELWRASVHDLRLHPGTIPKRLTMVTTI